MACLGTGPQPLLLNACEGDATNPVLPFLASLLVVKLSGSPSSGYVVRVCQETVVRLELEGSKVKSLTSETSLLARYRSSVSPVELKLGCRSTSLGGTSYPRQQQLDDCTKCGRIVLHALAAFFSIVREYARHAFQHQVLNSFSFPWCGNFSTVSTGSHRKHANVEHLTPSAVTIPRHPGRETNRRPRCGCSCCCDGRKLQIINASIRAVCSSDKISRTQHQPRTVSVLLHWHSSPVSGVDESSACHVVAELKAAYHCVWFLRAQTFRVDTIALGVSF